VRLDAYLEARGESAAAFARRAEIPYTTVVSILREGVTPGVGTAQAIVWASRREPAPDGGTVTYEDLIPHEQSA
jgi:predicted transcriptional regulator